MTIIRYEPSRVWVSDDRHEVDGAWIYLTRGDEEISGDIIPPEGDSPDCWLGDVYYSGISRDEIDALAEAAAAGANGRTGRIVISSA